MRKGKESERKAFFLLAGFLKTSIKFEREREKSTELFNLPVGFFMFCGLPFHWLLRMKEKEKRRTVLMFSIALASKIEDEFLISLSSFFMLYWVSYSHLF